MVYNTFISITNKNMDWTKSLVTEMNTGEREEIEDLKNEDLDEDNESSWSIAFRKNQKII
jgi:hypothetical protein